MNLEILNLENRIAKLRGKDPVGNLRLIHKAERRLRKLKSTQ